MSVKAVAFLNESSARVHEIIIRKPNASFEERGAELEGCSMRGASSASVLVLVGLPSAAGTRMMDVFASSSLPQTWKKRGKLLQYLNMNDWESLRGVRKL